MVGWCFILQLLSSNMEQNGEDDDGILGFLKEDIIKEYKRGRRLVSEVAYEGLELHVKCREKSVPQCLSSL